MVANNYIWAFQKNIKAPYSQKKVALLYAMIESSVCIVSCHG